MADDFLSDNYFDFDTRPGSSSILGPHSSLLDGYNDPDKLYLVPYRWWTEAAAPSGTVRTGVLYNVSSNIDDDNDEILLSLRKKEESGRIDDGEEGFFARQYALISETMWLRALRWHDDSEAADNYVHRRSLVEDHFQDMFSLQIRLSVFRGTSSLVVKISLKDNMATFFQRACNIFDPQSELLCIWDFSEQTTQFLVNNGISLPNGYVGQSCEEIVLELHVYGFPASISVGHDKSDGMGEHNKPTSSFGTISVKLNESIDFRGVGLLGLRGLENLGNTCFMNSAIQCLAHTLKLVDYFLDDYKKEINLENPLGMKGELALAFGDLLRKLWSPGSAPIAPRMFKFKLANFASQFSGSSQHDSQEFLAFLLDGLHEDLNRVKNKPYIEAKDVEDRLDKEVAEEYWQNHLARNDSVIVDLCQGQYRSTLVCPICNKKSVTFDPFMYLSLPLPSTTMRTMTLTVSSTDGTNLPSPVTVTVPKCGRLKDLIDALSIACSLRDDETLVMAEIFRNKIVRMLEEPSDSLALIRDDDKLAAYRLPKDDKASPLVVFLHERVEKPYEFEKTTGNRKLFGIPLVARLADLSNGFDLHRQFLKLLDPFLMPDYDILNDHDDVSVTANGDSAMEDVGCPTVLHSNTGSDSEIEEDPHINSDFQFFLKDDDRSIEIKMNDPISVSRFCEKLNVYVFWSDNMIEKYDTCLLDSLREVFKPQLFTKRPQECVSLYKCLEAFLKEEPLGPEDMWYCPFCKKHRQAIKKLDLWRLPEILVVHLKRFSYGRYFKNKLETYVEFPINDIDLSTYISHKDGRVSTRYVLYAIINHYGGMGGGHYTAFVDHGQGKWYEFDDERVEPVDVDRIKTSAAYVLFYRRIT